MCSAFKETHWRMATIVPQDANLAWSGVRLVLLNQQCRKMLQELAQVRGVQGACVCDNHGAVLGMLLAGGSDRRPSEQLARALCQCLVALDAQSAVKELEFHYERRLVVARDLGQALLIVWCGVDVNLPLLRMTLDVAASPFEADAELQRGLKHAALSRMHTLGQEYLDVSARGLLQKAGLRLS
jgi:predicted regulator of Ras-like GTPase activity (Roadblock/LC7/MglB family)